MTDRFPKNRTDSEQNKKNWKTLREG
jgi:hypothetical protein